MENNNKEEFLLVYGSLRKDEYNYNYFKSGLEFIRTLELPGYLLYSLGAYPGIKKTEDNLKTLEVDLFKVTNPSVGQSIKRMELSANYSIEEVNIEEGKATLYLYNGKISEENLVESGNWKKR